MSNSNSGVPARRTDDEQLVVSGTGGPDVKDIDIADDDHPLVEEAGDAVLEKQTESGAGEFLSDYIYESDSAWVREWFQNHETACYRAAKLLVRNSDEYPEGWLTLDRWVEAETGETVIECGQPQQALVEYSDDAKNLRKIEVKRPMWQVIEAARGLGYDPTIVFDVYRDERKIITEDNGIGMTPMEFDKAFNTIFASGAALDGESGGKFGVGSESSALVHGKEGGMEVETRSRRGDYRGFRAYSYLGGANALDGEVEDGFKGTRFLIPVQEQFNLSKLQEWVENYTEMLRVPVLYREHDAGSTPVEEEYEATRFFDEYEQAPVQIHRPGEFSVVAGPNVYDSSYRSDDDNTYLVSMPIERNSPYSINTFWSVVIRIEDEQGLIVHGPNRGKYREDVDLHEDDIVLPEPTGDRDRLQKDSQSKQFFRFIEGLVESKEMEEVSKIAERMDKADHPADAIRGNKSDWMLFKKMVNYYGSYRVKNSKHRFKELIKEYDQLPDFDKETRRKVFKLFTKVSYCRRSPIASTRKSDRKETSLGNILSNNDPDAVYMAASTGGNFVKYCKVVKNTHANSGVIVVENASKYDKWSDLFGFKILRDVPLEQSDEHDYDVPQAVHDSQQRKKQSNKNNRGKADKVRERELKIRTNNNNTSIDLRKSIASVEDRLERGAKLKGNERLILFPRTADENISDHYHMARYAAIASVSKTEYDELAHLDNVMTLPEYKEWSRNALIATEDGAMTPKELSEDERMVILAYRPAGDKKVVQLLGDDMEELRGYYCRDIRDQFSWAKHLDGYDGGFRGSDVGEVPDEDKRDTLFAVAGYKVLNRAEWAFSDLKTRKPEMMGIKFTRESFSGRSPCNWHTLNGNTDMYRLKADTPKWDDSSNIYNVISTNRDNPATQALLGLHDRGVDPTELEPEDVRELVS